MKKAFWVFVVGMGVAVISLKTEGTTLSRLLIWAYFASAFVTCFRRNGKAVGQ